VEEGARHLLLDQQIAVLHSDLLGYLGERVQGTQMRSGICLRESGVRAEDMLGVVDRHTCRTRGRNQPLKMPNRLPRRGAAAAGIPVDLLQDRTVLTARRLVHVDDE
jgi:hypothetical protein